MKKRPTIIDVARESGVSVMTVSRAINDRDGINAETRQKVLSIADKLGFRPSQVARGLVTSRTHTIGMVIIDITLPFFAQIARGAEDIAYQHDYNILLMNTAESIDRERRALEALSQKGVDGVVLCSSRLPQAELENYLQIYPYSVLINRSISASLPTVTTINVDDYSGAKDAVSYLVSKGRKAIGMIAGPHISLSAKRRVNGYKDGLTSEGLSLDETKIEYCASTLSGIKDGYTLMLHLLSIHPDIDAIVTHNDAVAVGVLQACAELNKSVPREIALIGADNYIYSTIVRPQITTMQTDLIAIGATAVEVLLNLFEGRPNSSPEILFSQYLVEREST